MTLAWMAWTWPTALFFIGIALTLTAMVVLETRRPTIERKGILRISTTRGDRLFISLLGSAFIHLAWLGLVGPHLWVASAVSIIYAGCIFRWA